MCSSDLLVEQGDFSVERLFKLKGSEGLQSEADAEVIQLSDRIKLLTEVPEDLKAVASEAMNDLERASEEAEKALLEAKKKIFLALGKDMSYEDVQEKLEPIKTQAEEARIKAFPEERLDKLEEQRNAGMTDSDVTTKPEEATLSENEAIPLMKLKSIPLPSGEAEALLVENNQHIGAEEARAMNVPAGQESSQEDVELKAGDRENISTDWEALITEELEKKKGAERDYLEAEKALQNFREERGEQPTPIERKYISALEAQLEMDRLAADHANTQQELYSLNQKIEEISDRNKNDKALDALIEKRNAKDVASRSLAQQFEEAAGLHDAVLAEYESSLEDFTEEAVEENEEHKSEERSDEEKEVETGIEVSTKERKYGEEQSDMDTKDPTGGSFGGATLERPLKLSSEDERNFGARAAGAVKEKRPSRLKSFFGRTKDAGKSLANSAFYPSMPSTEGGGASSQKKKRGFFGWLFSKKWL